MKMFRNSILLSIIPTVRPSLLHNKPLCRDCKFFIPNDRKCGKFYDVNLVTGHKTYENAFNSRYDEKKCGEEGKLFEPNNFKILTVPYYFTLNYWPAMIGFGAYVYFFNFISRLN